jgi:hypothetical protein
MILLAAGALMMIAIWMLVAVCSNDIINQRECGIEYVIKTIVAQVN